MKVKITEEQRSKLEALRKRLAKRAIPMGSLHSYWDIIVSVDQILQGDKPYVFEDPQQLIEYCEKTLQEAA